MDMNMVMDLDREEDVEWMEIMKKNILPGTPMDQEMKSAKSRRVLSLNSITIEDFYDYFDKPIVAVAREFGVCTTLFKKICRKSGIQRWPYRKISSLSKTIEAIEESLTQDLTEVERTKMLQQLDELIKRRDFVRRNPNSKVALVKPAEALSITGRCLPTKSRPKAQEPTQSDESDVQSPPYVANEYDLCDGLDFSPFANLYMTNPLMATDLDDYNCVVEI